MKKLMSQSYRRGNWLLILIMLLTPGAYLNQVTPVAAKQAGAPAADLPATPCVPAGSNGLSCELWAVGGTLTLPDGVSVPVWGFAATAAGSAQLPNPPVIATEGQVVSVTLHNTLPVSTTLSLEFPGQSLPPDLEGIGQNGSVTYQFTAGNPGTYLYEAGKTPNGNRQVLMGMIGALVVRPSDVTYPNSAHGDLASSFDQEQLVMLGEVDPAFNTSPDPLAFDLRDYKPRYWLINGQAYPQTTPISVLAGQRLLLRYINTGADEHDVSVLGLQQTFLGTDSNPLSAPFVVASETIAAGEAYDAITTIPANAPAGMEYTLSTNHSLNNAGKLLPNGRVDYGGAMLMLQVTGTAPVSDTVGPLATSVMISPSLTTGMMPIMLQAMLDDAVNGAPNTSNVTAAEYFIDNLGPVGSGTPLTGTYGGPVVMDASASITLPVDLMDGSHVVYVRGLDTAGNWGAVNAAILTVAMAGPETRDIQLMAALTNGTSPVAVQATGDSRNMGNQNVIAAEFFVDATGDNGTGTPLTLNQVNQPVASLDGSIPLTVTSVLTEGAHTVYVHSQDALNQWGAFGNAALTIDKTGPLANMVDILPNPNNGTIAFDVDHQALRLSATVNDLPAGGVNSNLAAAEAFIDPVLPVVNGSGITMMPVDGVWNSANEQVFIWIPLSQLNVLATGAHTVAVHGLDTAGNWGALSNTTLVVDRSGPLVSNLAIGPSPVIMRAPQATNAMSATLTASATDPANGAAQASNVTAAEWFDGADPGPGMGSPMSAPGGFNTPSVNLSAVINNLAGWSDGDHILSVRARDVAGNWGDVVTTTLTITSNLNGNILATSFENGLAAWSGVVGNVQTLPQAAMGTDGGTHGMDAVIGSGQGGPGLGLAAPDAGVPQPAYVFDTTPSGEILYHASFFFNPNSANPGSSPIEIFVGLDKRSLPVFGVQFEPSTTQPNYELRAWVMQNGTQVFTDWYDISNAPHQVEIAWQSNSSSGFNLLIDGFLRRSLHGDTSAYTLDSVRLGPSSGLTATATGSLYFDQFNSNRLNAVKYNLHLPVVLR